MRLLRQVEDGGFELTKELREQEIPRYAILSHTWSLNDADEISFQDFDQGFLKPKIEYIKPDGIAKLRFCADQAARNGLSYVWVDTCCIDKDSSAVLQEAITSMFAWYRDAAACYVYLVDVSMEAERTVEGKAQGNDEAWREEFRQSRWFTRGWTLQELLAPPSVEFFSREGGKLGDKTSLEQSIHEITGIPHRALRDNTLTGFSTAEQLAWTDRRNTKRREDKAYSLLGIFNIFMPLIYGEGDYAWTRLMKEIDRAHTENAKLDHILLTLPIATEAPFNSLKNQHEPTCLRNTRAELLEEIKSWIDGHDQRCMFWLNGIAGTGKSTIARTVARTYHGAGSLGGSFFFSRGGGDLNNARRFVTTLARQLASRIPGVNRHIREAVMDHSDIVDQSLRDQWDLLILQPLSKLSADIAPHTVVFVVDALDECDNEGDIRALIKVLVSARSLNNVRLRVFITSRPEIPIRHGFGKIPDSERQVVVLHKIEPKLVDRDLQLFFEKSFSTIRDERGFTPDDWPGIQTIKRLVDISCGLFIWASTACRYIREGKRFAKKRIKELISRHRSGAGPEEQLDRIYTTVLQSSIHQGYHEDEKSEIYETLRRVLGSIVVLYSPLSKSSLGVFLGIPLDEVEDSLVDLHTIFHIEKQSSAPIRLHHPTFRDFLLDRDRCSDPNFWVDEKMMHKMLADSCIDLMSKMLKRNICDLESPGTALKDIKPDRISQCLPLELQYACLYWIQHHRQSGEHLRDGDKVHRFLQEHFLHWVEAVSLIGKGADLGAMVRLYHSCLAPARNVNQAPFIEDARRLLVSFQTILEDTPLQIYCAALAFMPSAFKSRLSFAAEMRPWLSDVQIAEADIPKPKDDFKFVNDLAFTPDGKYLAAGSNIGIIRIWDLGTHAAVRKLDASFTDQISSVSISPGGDLICAGSDDSTVVVWDFKTGVERYTITSHSGWMNSVLFSPDGKTLATGSMDETIILWHAETGREIKRIDNQSRCIHDAAFSPDGALIATSSSDTTVRIWDIWKEADTCMTLDGHSGPVNSVKFSPVGNHVISGSDDLTIKLWDTTTGTECVTFKGHSQKIMAVTFTYDGAFVISGSADATIKVWNATNGNLLHNLQDHKCGINALNVSPDGFTLASSSFDDETRLWKTATWELCGELEEFEHAITGQWIGSAHTGPDGLPLPETKGHSSKITCLARSFDDQAFASGSEDATVKLWLNTGAEHRKLIGHADGITDLIFSNDARLIASASADTTVRLWDVSSGGLRHILNGHSAPVRFIRLSSDNRQLISGSDDATVLLWDVLTGMPLATYGGHSNGVNDAVFSPDNRLIVSCSADSITPIWDIANKKVFSTLVGHSAPVQAVAFSADGQSIVSCSDDTTIRLWSRSGTAISQMKGSAVSITSLAISTDNCLLASCSADGRVKVWDRRTGSVVATMDAGKKLQKIVFSASDQCLETDWGTLDIPSNAQKHLRKSHSLYVRDAWLQKDSHNFLWLPEEYRATAVMTWIGGIVLGHKSGSISFVYL